MTTSPDFKTESERADYWQRQFESLKDSNYQMIQSHRALKDDINQRNITICKLEGRIEAMREMINDLTVPMVQKKHNDMPMRE